MSAVAIEARLRMMSHLAATEPRRSAVDMRSEAVTRRLRELSEVTALCFQLVKLGRGKV